MYWNTFYNSKWYLDTFVDIYDSFVGKFDIQKQLLVCKSIFMIIVIFLLYNEHLYVCTTQLNLSRGLYLQAFNKS